MEDTSLSSDNLGKIPTHGVFSIRRWAEFWESTEPSVRRWVRKYKIPFIKPGDTMFIDARDFLKRVPYHEQEDDMEPLEE